MAGRKPGGPKTGGRAKGTPNKATRDIKQAAREYTEQALATLVKVMEGGEGVPAAAQVSAAREILDRAYGKPMQAVEHSGPNGGPMETINANMTAKEAAELYRAELG